MIVPQAVKDLKAKAEGNSIILSFSIPVKNTDGSPLTDLRGFKLLRSMRRLSEGCDNCPRKFVPLVDIEYQPSIAPLPVKEEKKEFRDTNLSPGTEYQYKVFSINSQDEYSGESNSAKAFWDIPPVPVEGFTAETGSGTVTLSWKKVEILSDGSLAHEPIFYNCYFAEEEKTFPFMPANGQPLEVLSYQIADLKNDQAYIFRVSALRKVGDGWVESEPSSPVTAKPVDIVPPSVPQSLTAFWMEDGISLRWESSPEPDVLGYNLYRWMEGETAWKRLNPTPLPLTIFLDKDAKKGKVYYYAVSAVDNSSRRNESSLSEEVKVTYFP
jgi:hypothetical protein